MCGIVAYAGAKHNVSTLVDGLRRLEYRGYDSAGVALIENNKVRIIKSIGKVSELQKKIDSHWGNSKKLNSPVGIAHTRWATHGVPSEINAHPHTDNESKFAIVHNGIIDNYVDLKKRLIAHGCKFVSETDSEVIAHLISVCYEGDLISAVAAAMKKIEGTFGLAVICADQPDCLVVARRGSPIVIGVGSNDTLVASDVSAILAHTNRVIYLNDDDIALISAGDIDIRNIDNVPVEREVAHVSWSIDEAGKGGYEHFMLKEIFEQPAALANAIRGRIDEVRMSGLFSGLNMSSREVALTDRVVIASCGTSMHAGLVSEYYFEDLASLPTEVAQAAEFRYRNPIIEPDTLVLAISQSGETADTLAAVREAANKGAVVASICNVVGSTIARETGRGVYLHAGPEIGVASTKAFTCQVAVLLLLAIKFGRSKRLARTDAAKLLEEIKTIPELVEKVLARAADIEKVAEKYYNAHDFFYIGRGYLYPVALEGALKLKEISYIHAEGYHAAELKHGPIALLEESVPVVALANDIPGKDKVIGNIQECRARKSPVIATATDGDKAVASYADDILWIPACSQYVAPIPTVVALQLLAYYIAKKRGCSIDQPRNLAKSVTVE